MTEENETMERTSRIFVTNLPKYFDTKQLTNFYEQYGEVTDCQVIRKTGGESRRYGFVGFKTEDEAKFAIEETNQTFIDTSRIQASFSSIKEEKKSKKVNKSKETTNKDLEFLKSKTVETEDEEKKDEIKEDSGRILVTNLPYTTTEEELEEHFKKFGDITEVHICIDKETKKSKGMAFILFMIPECSKKALNAHKKIFQGRIIKVIEAEPQPQNNFSLMNESDSSSYKKKLLAKKKKTASDSKNWNSLFMKSDTVVDSISKQLNLSKSDILDQDADNMAVRVALGETELIKQTKEDLAKEGIDFDTKNERSKKMLLIKNLPKDTTEKELFDMFSQSGNVSRVVIPRSQTIALVEYNEASEARSALRFFAYKNFKHVPLFLEWAPVVKTKKKDEIVKITENETQIDDQESAVLFIKNLNFTTTKETLEDLFQKFGKIRKFTLLQGYGFIEFDNLRNAIEAKNQLNNQVIDQHQIVIQFSNIQKKQPTEKQRRELKFRKLVVKNLAFEATKKDIFQLFSPFGEIKLVRLPQKVSGGHRGFAFVEFTSSEECGNAFESLKNSHLYGRHLVLQIAEDDESQSKKRQREEDRFGGDQNEQKKRK